jgi:hypothetical protein
LSEVLTLAERLGATLDRVIAQRDAAEKKIAEHNAECIRLCDGRKRCGYEKYRDYMSCSDCPKDWIIE